MSVKSLIAFLECRKYVVESDHAPLQWLDMVKLTNQRLICWSLTLLEFSFDGVRGNGLFVKN